MTSNLYCAKCGNHYKVEETKRCLEDDLKEHFYCNKCEVEMYQEYELEDNNLDSMREAIKEAEVLRRDLILLENKFMYHSDQYFDAWNNRPLEWGNEQ